MKTAWDTMQELDMSVPSAHIGAGFGWFTMSAGSIAENILMIHETYGIRDFVLSAPFGSSVLAKCWAGTVGDEGEIMKRYADRIVSIHLKDFYQQYRNGYTHKNMPVEAFAPIGEGAIRIKEILNMVESLPHFAGNIIIDQDKSSGAMLDALKTGLENILDMLEESKAGILDCSN